MRLCPIPDGYLRAKVRATTEVSHAAEWREEGLEARAPVRARQEVGEGARHLRGPRRGDRRSTRSARARASRARARSPRRRARPPAAAADSGPVTAPHATI